jgi:SET domain-containing protein 6
MVPIADAFNHTEENHVHLETDWQVCSECGSLEMCEHDAQENTSNVLGGRKLEHSYDMVLNASLPTDKTGEDGEVYNTYDSRGIDNVHLLCRYGFTLEGNSRDVVLFATEEVIEAGGIATAIDDAIGEFGFGSSEMINTAIRDLGIDAEGRISFRIWAAFVPAANLMRLTRAQCWVEIQSVVEQGEDGSQGIPSDTKPTQRDLLDILEAVLKVIRLCDRRLERMWDPINDGDPTSTSSSSNEMLFGGSVHSDKESTALEMAWSYVLGERAIIEACRTVWVEFSMIVQDRLGPSREGEEITDKVLTRSLCRHDTHMDL